MKKINILLVDDHPFVVDGIRHFIEKDPKMEVVGAVNSGQAALDALERQPADVVVLDVSMPGKLDGLDTAIEIRRRHPDTKIVLLTMFDDSQRIVKALQIGVHGYVLKEKNRETLLMAIHTVLTGNEGRYYSPDLLAKVGNLTLARAQAGQNVDLTKREKEIICLMAQEPNLTTKQMGEALNIAAYTVQTHIRNVKEKLGLSKSAELVKYAVEKQLCEE